MVRYRSEVRSASLKGQDQVFVPYIVVIQLYTTSKAREKAIVVKVSSISGGVISYTQVTLQCLITAKTIVQLHTTHTFVLIR